MKKFSLAQRYQTEKAIIDALLKISEIIKKTTNTNQYSKKTSLNSDKNQLRHSYDYNEIYDRSVSSPMRTLDSYVSDFNSHCPMSSSLQRGLNCKRAPILLWNSRSNNKQYYSSLKKRKYNNNYRDQESLHKHHHHYDILSSSSTISTSSNNHYRKKSLQHSRKYKSSRSNKKRRFKCKCQSLYDDNEYSASDC